MAIEPSINIQHIVSIIQRSVLNQQGHLSTSKNESSNFTFSGLTYP